MASTTPQSAPRNRLRSKSPHSRSRPTTPLRPSSRSSLRDSVQRARGPYNSSTTTPLDLLQDDFAELSDAMADLESNFMQLQLMHESLARFSESFAGFLYGMNMNAFCVDFPEAPIPESFKRPQNDSTNPLSFSFGAAGAATGPGGTPRRNQDPNVPDVEATFLTTDTSFVENPESSKMTPSKKAPTKFQTPAPASRTTAGRGRGIPTRGGGISRGGGIPTRGGGIPRGTRGGSGIARGSARGTGIGRGTGTSRGRGRGV